MFFQSDPSFSIRQNKNSRALGGNAAHSSAVCFSLRRHCPNRFKGSDALLRIVSAGNTRHPCDSVYEFILIRKQDPVKSLAQLARVKGKNSLQIRNMICREAQFIGFYRSDDQISALTVSAIT